MLITATFDQGRSPRLHDDGVFQLKRASRPIGGENQELFAPTARWMTTTSKLYVERESLQTRGITETT